MRCSSSWKQLARASWLHVQAMARACVTVSREFHHRLLNRVGPSRTLVIIMKLLCAPQMFLIGFIIQWMIFSIVDTWQTGKQYHRNKARKQWQVFELSQRLSRASLAKYCTKSITCMSFNRAYDSGNPSDDSTEPGAPWLDWLDVLLNNYNNQVCWF